MNINASSQSSSSLPVNTIPGIEQLKDPLIGIIMEYLPIADYQKVSTLSDRIKNLGVEIDGGTPIWSALYQRDYPLLWNSVVSLLDSWKTPLKNRIKLLAHLYQAHYTSPWIPQLPVMRHGNTVTGVIQLSNGCLASSSTDNNISIWSLDGEQIAVIRNERSRGQGLTQLFDGRIASGSDGTIGFWSYGENLSTISGFKRPSRTIVPTCITELSDGRIVVGDSEGPTWVWSADGTENFWIQVFSAKFIKELFDGRIALATFNDIFIQTVGSKEFRLKGHTDEVTCLTQLSDGRIASGSADHTIRIWTLDGEEPFLLLGHTDRITCITQLSDGRIATGSADHTIRIWPLNGGEPIVLQGHTNEVTCITQLSDGRIVSGSMDRSILFWNITPIDLVSRATQLAQITQPKPIEEQKSNQPIETKAKKKQTAIQHADPKTTEFVQQASFSLVRMAIVIKNFVKMVAGMQKSE